MGLSVLALCSGDNNAPANNVAANDNNDDEYLVFEKK
jgi:hypothetical protein